MSQGGNVPEWKEDSKSSCCLSPLKTLRNVAVKKNDTKFQLWAGWMNALFCLMRHLERAPFGFERDLGGLRWARH